MSKSRTVGARMNVDDPTIAGRSLQLPLFEGEQPTGVEMTFAGRVERLTPGLHVGETVHLLVVGEITAVNHKQKGSDSIVRAHTVSVDDAFLIDDEEAEYRMSELNAAYKAATDSLTGRMAIPGVDVTITASTPDGKGKGDDSGSADDSGTAKPATATKPTSKKATAKKSTDK